MFIAVMSCRRQREEASGIGGSAVKAIDEDDDYEDRWSEDDDEGTDAGSVGSHARRINGH